LSVPAHTSKFFGFAGRDREQVDGVDVLETVGERRLALYVAAGAWTIATLIMVFATAWMPDLHPKHATAWRTGLIAVAAVVAISHLSWLHRLSDRGVYIAINVTTLLSWAMFLNFMWRSPQAAGAIMICLLPAFIYAGNFLRRREMTLQLIVGSAVAVSPLLFAYDVSVDNHMMSRLAVFIPSAWLIAAALQAQRTMRLRAVAEIRRWALTDPLTGLSNTRAFRRRAEQLFSDARSNGTAVGALVIDLDDFASINARFGQDGGDCVLRGVATQLDRIGSGRHTVARLGGDTFAVLVPDASRSELETLASLCKGAVRGASVEPPALGVEAHASVGAAIWPEDGATLDDLLTRAEQSLYQDKTKYALDHLPVTASGLYGTASSEPTGFGSRGEWETAPAPLIQRIGKLGAFEWRRLPDYARYGGIAWVLAAVSGLIAIEMPDADRSHATMIYICCGAAFATAIVQYFTAAEVGTIRYDVCDLLAHVAVAVTAYWAGGIDGPAWILILFVVLYNAWFVGLRSAILRSVLSVMVVLSPLLYEYPFEGGDVVAQTSIATMTAGVAAVAAITYSLLTTRSYVQRMQQLSVKLLMTDPLTALPNRRALRQRLDDELGATAVGSSRRTPEFAVVVIDLDGFKNVNVYEGYRAGDAALLEIAEALKKALPPGVFLARHGGDEFAAVLPDTGEGAVQSVAVTMVAAINGNNMRSSHLALRHVVATAGFALYPLHGDSVAKLMQAADTALVAAKTGSGVDRVSGLVYAL
jgi:diguanylate cyclase (GGDEF)-like protein